jgi:hypothetical protein
MQLSDFHTGRPAVKFTEITTREFPTVEGEIIEEPELVPDKFGTGSNDKCLVLTIEGEDTVVRTLFARKQQLGTIGDAVAEAGTTEIERGGHLAMWLAAEKPSTRGAIPQKVYGAYYAPPGAIGSAALEFTEPAEKPASNGKRKSSIKSTAPPPMNGLKDPLGAGADEPAPF